MSDGAIEVKKACEDLHEDQEAQRVTIGGLKMTKAQKKVIRRKAHTQLMEAVTQNVKPTAAGKIGGVGAHAWELQDTGEYKRANPLISYRTPAALLAESLTVISDLIRNHPWLLTKLEVGAFNVNGSIR